jgi:hypothetical protein
MPSQTSELQMSVTCRHDMAEEHTGGGLQARETDNADHVDFLKGNEAESV